MNDFALQISSDQLGDLYRQFISNYPIVSIEDPYDQDDWEAYTKLTGSVQIQIVGSVSIQIQIVGSVSVQIQIVGSVSTHGGKIFYMFSLLSSVFHSCYTYHVYNEQCVCNTNSRFPAAFNFKLQFRSLKIYLLS